MMEEFGAALGEDAAALLRRWGLRGAQRRAVARLALHAFKKGGVPRALRAGMKKKLLKKRRKRKGDKKGDNDEDKAGGEGKDKDKNA